jgi:IS30 family transposase
MARRLSTEERVTIKVLAEKGVPKRQIARELGVDEGTVRYQLKRAASDQVDGRKNKPRKAAAFAGLIAEWIKAHSKAE